MLPEFDLTNQQFGDWTVLRYAGRKNRATHWLCRCKCGRVQQLPAGNLRRGLSNRCRSCARKRQRKLITFQGKTLAASDWAKYLGIRRKTLEARLRKHPVEVALQKRIPPSPNLGNPRLLTFRGKTLSVVQWARHLGLSKQALHQRLQRMPVSQALANPGTPKRRQAGQKGYQSRMRRKNRST